MTETMKPKQSEPNKKLYVEIGHALFQTNHVHLLIFFFVHFLVDTSQ